MLPSVDNKNKNGSDHPNTCRSMTADQWEEFDKELKYWLILNERSVSKTEEVLCKFSVKPNLQVKIRKSKLIIKDFLECVNTREESIGKLDDAKSISYVLDCILEHKSMVR